MANKNPKTLKEVKERIKVVEQKFDNHTGKVFKRYSQLIELRRLENKLKNS